MSKNKYHELCFLIWEISLDTFLFCYLATRHLSYSLFNPSMLLSYVVPILLVLFCYLATLYLSYSLFNPSILVSYVVPILLVFILLPRYPVSFLFIVQPFPTCVVCSSYPSSFYFATSLPCIFPVHCSTLPYLCRM